MARKSRFSQGNELIRITIFGFFFSHGVVIDIQDLSHIIVLTWKPKSETSQMSWDSPWTLLTWRCGVTTCVGCGAT